MEFNLSQEMEEHEKNFFYFIERDSLRDGWNWIQNEFQLVKWSMSGPERTTMVAPAKLMIRVQWGPIR